MPYKFPPFEAQIVMLEPKKECCHLQKNNSEYLLTNCKPVHHKEFVEQMQKIIQRHLDQQNYPKVLFLPQRMLDKISNYSKCDMSNS